MKRRLPVFVVLLAAGVARLDAGDSITTRDKLSVFGRVVELNQDTVTLVARFPSNDPQKPVSEETMTLKRADLLSIEFSRTTFNPGGPPSIGLKPAGTGAAPAQAPRPPADVVILNGGERRECEAAIKDDYVQCGTLVVERRKVIRILLGGR